MSVETLTYTALAERLKISPEAAGDYDQLAALKILSGSVATGSVLGLGGCQGAVRTRKRQQAVASCSSGNGRTFIIGLPWPLACALVQTLKGALQRFLRSLSGGTRGRCRQLMRVAQPDGLGFTATGS